MIALGADTEVITAAAKPVKPCRPRRDGLTYTVAELCWALGISPRQFRRKRHLLPKPIPITTKPLWCRAAIAEWVQNGCRKAR